MVSFERSPHVVPRYLRICLIMRQPPRRSAPAETAKTPKSRQSKLAKEHNITNEEEQEIREAFGLFSHEKKGEKEGVIPTGDVRRAMM